MWCFVRVLFCCGLYGRRGGKISGAAEATELEAFYPSLNGMCGSVAFLRETCICLPQSLGGGSSYKIYVVFIIRLSNIFSKYLLTFLIVSVLRVV